jgi:hypothetical protein
MNKGFDPLKSAFAHTTTYWESGASPNWEALGWKREIDTCFSRAMKPQRAIKAQIKVSEPQILTAFSIFDEADTKRSQNCAIIGRRLVSVLPFNKSMGVEDVIVDLIEGLCDRSREEHHQVLLDLFSTAFEVNGVQDKASDAIFRHLQKQDPEDIRLNMKTHEYLLYQLRIEHDTRDVKRQLECLKNAHYILYSDAQMYIEKATCIHNALVHTQNHMVRNVVGAMREMAAYYLHGNNNKFEYIPDMFKFSVSIQEKNDSFSKIFLTYYRMPCKDSEFGDFITDCCRIFAAAGRVDWAERDLAMNTFKDCLRVTDATCMVFSRVSVVWQAFRDNELHRMRDVVAELETLDAELRSLMHSVTTSMGITDSQSVDLFSVFESIFLSLSRSMKLVAVKRRELQVDLNALIQSQEIGRVEEDVRLLGSDVVDPYDGWPSLCKTGYFEMLRHALMALMCSSRNSL